MRIGFDCSGVTPSYIGGTHSFVRGLAHGVVKSKCNHTVQLYVTEENAILFEGYRGLPGVSVIEVPTIATNHYARHSISCLLELARSISFRIGCKSIYSWAHNLLWSEGKKLIENQSDIVYFPCTLLPVFDLDVPTYLSLHDIQQVHFPQFFSKPELYYREFMYNLSVDNASYIQASTNFMKADFLAYFKNLSEDQIFVIPEGVDLDRFNTQVDYKHYITGFRLPPSFLFYPAQLWPHKNHLTLLKALKKIETRKQLKIPLVLTGKEYSAAPAVMEYISVNSMDYVHYLGVVSVDEIVGLYQQSRMLVMPTLFESSSLPILEAIATGTPVLSSNIPPLREMGNYFQIDYFDPNNPDQLADSIINLWMGCGDTEPQVRSNLDAIRDFSWDRIARRYIQFFEQTASG